MGESNAGDQEAGGLIAEGPRLAFAELVAANGGAEVFATGDVDDATGLVVSLVPMAFGNRGSVPAPAQGARPGQVLVHNHPSGGLEPSDADIGVASVYGKAGVGFYIVDNAVARARVVVRPFKPVAEARLDPAALVARFGPGGQVSRAMPGYEHRPQQMEMMLAVARAFSEDRIAVVEAGTGTGKSFAYLAPALRHALTNKRRVVVSTHTINLQEQLVAKDIPGLAGLLGWNAKVALVKGRGNYVSLRRLAIAGAEAKLFADDRTAELEALGRWAAATPDGSRGDLAFEVAEETWDAVQSDKDDCLRARCPTFDSCHFYRSRRMAAAADVVVANHHLVMADLAVRRDATGPADFTAILPPYDRVVFDEAHHLEDVATSYFSTETSLPGIRRALQRLASGRGDKGAAPRLGRALATMAAGGASGGGGETLAGKALRTLGDEVVGRRRDVEGMVELHLTDLFHAALGHWNIRDLPRRERRELRVTEAVLNSPFWVEATSLLEGVVTEIATLTGPAARVLDLVSALPEEALKELADPRQALAAAAAKLAAHAEAAKFFLAAGDEDHCRWIEVGWSRDRPVARPCTAPLDVAPDLKATLFARKRTVVLTSATLAVEGRFDYVKKQLGLGAPRGAGRNGATWEPETVPEPVAPAGAEGSAPADDGDGWIVTGPEPGGGGAPTPAADFAAAVAAVPGRVDTLLLGTPFDYRTNCLVGVTLDTPDPRDPAFEERLAPVVGDALEITGGRAFVLFTSHRGLDRMHAALRGRLAAAGITALRQGEMPRHALIEAFRSSPRAALFATSSFWEGIDVPGRALELVVLTRLPFSVPTTPILEARAERIGRRGGNAFMELTVPMAVIRFKQGFGRLIRTRTDRGVVLVTDPRVSAKAYGRTFLKSLPDPCVVMDSADAVLAELEAFHRAGLD